MLDFRGDARSEERLRAIIDALAAMACGDLRPRAPISDRRDLVDAICTGINVLAEEVSFRQARDQEKSQQLEATLLELRETQAQLVQSAKLAALGEFSSGLAHEFNNPLMIIRGFVSEVQNLCSAGGAIQIERLNDRLSKINSTIDRMARLIHHMQTFSRPEREARRLPLPLNDIVDAALDLAQGQARIRSIPIDIEYSKPGPVIEANAIALEQVVLNLVSNACDAIGERGGNNGRILVRTEIPNDSEATLQIVDNGIGISKENLARIYTPFFTTKPPGRGTGLGLSISQRIVSAHQGKMVCESQPGFGTTFTLHFPRIRAVEATLGAASQSI